MSWSVTAATPIASIARNEDLIARHDRIPVVADTSPRRRRPGTRKESRPKHSEVVSEEVGIESTSSDLNA